MSERLSAEENLSRTSEAKIQEFRKKNVKLYNNIQIELLLRKYGNQEEIDRLFEEAVELNSAEYAEAFYQIIGGKINADAEFQSKQILNSAEISEEISQKIEELQALEQSLLKNTHREESHLSFLDWHKKYGRKLMSIIHNNPELLLQFEESKDKNPEVERAVLEKIETELYR